MAYQFEKSGAVKELTAEELEEADKETTFIVLFRGFISDDAPYWAYIAVKPSLYRQYIQAVEEKTPIVPEDYGPIMQEGFDAEVPESIRAEMKQDYGCDDNYMDFLVTDVKAAQMAFVKQQETERINNALAMMKKKAGESDGQAG